MIEHVPTIRHRACGLARLAMCVLLVLVVGRSSATLFEAARAVTEAEAESRAFQSGESELLQSESPRRRIIGHRVEGPSPRVVVRRCYHNRTVREAREHVHFRLTHQQNAIGRPLLC